MHRHLHFLCFLLVTALFLTVVLAADPDFVDYDQPSPVPLEADSTSAAAQATPTKFIDALKFWKRYTWRDFYFEYAVMSLAALYYGLHSLGRSRNTRLAQNWVRATHSLFTSQFAQFGIPSVDGRVVPLSHDGGGVYETYATGRVGIKRLWVEIKMVSRHDVVAWVVEVVGGFLFDWWAAGEGDMIEISIEPDGNWEGFTWGVVRKGKMRRLKESRYDLGFTRLTESNLLPQSLAILTELPEITDTVFAPNKSLLKAIDDAQKWFDYLVISDFPEDAPKSVDALSRGLKNRITLVTKLPSTKEGLAATTKLLEQVILLVDNLGKLKFRSEVSKKLKTTRTEAVSRFSKSLAALEETPTQQDLAQKKKLDKEKLEKERVSKLSAEEQRKFIEKERKSKTKQKVKRG